jgi:BirA family biotin operon repressor/biotin-[acetyl-CoA-carboxylase] ligase
LSPLAGLVACEALHNLLGAHTKGLYLKWPNDIQWYDAKLAGVLVESTRNLGVEGGYTVVIGIGLNLYDAPALSHALGRPVADWRSVTEQTEGPACSISALVCATATAWYQALNELQENGFAAFTSRFEQVDALAGRRVHVVDQGAVLMSGIAGGIDTQGRLLLHTSAGTTPVCVGEISIRLPV